MASAHGVKNWDYFDRRRAGLTQIISLPTGGFSRSSYILRIQ